MNQAQLTIVKSLVRGIIRNDGLLDWFPNPWGISPKSLIILFLGVVEGLTPQQIIKRLYPERSITQSLVTSVTDMLHDAERIVEGTGPVDEESSHSVISAIDQMVVRDKDDPRVCKELGEGEAQETDSPDEEPTPTISKPIRAEPPPSNCPRCRGAMIPEEDWYGEYATCLSCGYVRESVATPPLN